MDIVIFRIMTMLVFLLGFAMTFSSIAKREEPEDVKTLYAVLSGVLGLLLIIIAIASQFQLLA